MYDAAAVEQQLMAISKHGNRLTCPGCGGEEFYIYRSNNTASVNDDNNEMVVECKNSQCQIVTQTFALKTWYQEYGEKYRELTRYAHTTYIKYDPPHFEKWQCPRHPGVKTIHIDEYIEDMLPV
jgi:hypothetical protein